MVCTAGNNPSDYPGQFQLGFYGFYSRITMPSISSDPCNWVQLTWEYVNNSWSLQGNGNVFDPSLSLTDTIFTNTDFTAGFTHDFGSSSAYGSIGAINYGDTLIHANFQIAKTPLIFIPGIMGSKFAVNGSAAIPPIQKQKKDANGNCIADASRWSYSDGDLVWIDERNDVNNFFNNIIPKYANSCSNYLDVLGFNTNGQPLYPQVGLSGAVTDHPYNNVTIPYLEQQGYVLNRDLFVFPYDWRQDITSSETQLEASISAILTQTGSAKVDIIRDVLK